MRLLLTGADTELGEMLTAELGSQYEIMATGTAASASAEGYEKIDLGDPEQVEPRLTGVDAVVHALPFGVRAEAGDQADQHLLDDVPRGTYVLTKAAADRGVGRLVLISRLDLLADYPADYLVGPDWRPLPRPEAESLAVFSAELACREIARTGRIDVTCLRFAGLGDAEGTTVADAVAAIEYALAEPAVDHSHHWQLRHVASGGRFAQQGWHPPAPESA